jgi:transcriptional regulator with XRE-family HTH domain
MGRTVSEIIGSLPKERQQRVEDEFQQLKQEVDSLRELRQATGKAQAEIAAALKIKQPSVSKIERQADMYISTLRSYVEAIGGELELTVRLPSRPPLRLRQLSDMLEPGPRRRAAAAATAKSRRRVSDRKAKRPAAFR